MLLPINGRLFPDELTGTEAVVALGAALVSPRLDSKLFKRSAEVVVANPLVVETAVVAEDAPLGSI